jgi:DNA-binding response OmpR family regulator
MMKPFVGGPLILLVDDNPGRAEYCEYFFFQNGYLVKTATLDNLEEKGIMEDVKLILSYLPFKPEIVTEQGIPVIFMITNDSPIEKNTTSDGGLVHYLSASLNSDALFEKIAVLINA